MSSSSPETTRLYATSLRHFLGPVAALLDDPSVSEVLVNGIDGVYAERAGRLELTSARFGSERALEAAVSNIAQFVGRPLTPSTVRLDARLPDGSRVHAVRAPCSRRGPVIAIRKFSRKKFDLAHLVRLGALSDSAREFLEISVALRISTVVSGGTGTGKTSLLNALSGAIPAEERIIVIEDTAELQLQQPHVVSLEARIADQHGRGAIGIRELFMSSLRLRPDRIVIGEVRAAEALDMIQAMTSGHPGSLTTLHADRPEDALRRLETMAMMGTIDLPHSVIRTQVSSAVQLIVQLARFADGSRRVTDISEVTELTGSGQYEVVSLYRFRGQGIDESGRISGQLEPTGQRPTYSDRAHALGHSSAIVHSRDLWGTP